MISAYACEPDKGSEPGAGWNWAVQVARKHSVVVLTRTNNRESIERELQRNPQPNMTFLYYDLPDFLRRWKKGQRGVQLYYALWQIGAYHFVKSLHKKEPFTLVFAVTFGTMWLPTLMYKLPAPFIWGPLGGGEGVPRQLWPRLTKKQRIFERVRRLNRYVCITNPWFRPACKKASALIMRTGESVACIPKKYRQKCKIMLETGVTLEQCDTLGMVHKEQSQTFVVCGRLVGLKLIDIAIRAMKQVVQEFPGATLKIVGDGECERALKNLTEQLEIQKNICFTGRLTKAESIREIQKAAALVVSSGREGGAWVLYEAMMCKTPIVCMDTSGMHILVEPNGGIKLPVADYNTMVQRFADAMLWMLRHPEEAKLMGEAGHHAVRQKWTWDKKGDFFESVLENLPTKKYGK